MQQKQRPNQAPLAPFRSSLNLIGISQVGLFTLAALYAIYHAKPVLLPLVLSLLLTMVLKPAQRTLCKFRMPGPVAAAVVVMCLLAALFTGGNQLAGPASEWMDTIDVRSVESRFAAMFAPIQEMQKDLNEVVKKVDAMTDAPAAEEENDGARVPEASRATSAQGADDTTGGEAGANSVTVTVDAGKKPMAVEISERPVSALLRYVQNFGVYAVATLLLIFFFLGFGETMHRRLSEDDGTANLIKSVSTDVSAYLFTITAINAALGVSIGCAMWLMGMPNPVLWGVMGALLNFVPYLGAIAGSVVVFLVAVASFDEPTVVFAVPVVYFGLTAIEGNVVTPMIIGKRFTLNPIVVALWFMSWGAIWGVPGMLIATPTLMAFKIVCANFPALDRVDRVIST
ncbi:MAG: AI-2E family transporter [Verrucomicrobiales bacterium]